VPSPSARRPTALLCEFKDQIAEYLASVGHVEARSLADLIAFDSSHCWQELTYFGQELFEVAQATGGMADPAYQPARDFCILKSRTEGIDAAIRDHDLDAIVAPTWSLLISVAAVAGYPSLSVPVGYRADGTPVGFMFAGGPLQEGKLLGFAYDLEQELQAWSAPTYLGAVPLEPGAISGAGGPAREFTGHRRGGPSLADSLGSPSRDGQLVGPDLVRPLRAGP
jgi:amidase